MVSDGDVSSPVPSTEPMESTSSGAGVKSLNAHRLLQNKFNERSSNHCGAEDETTNDRADKLASLEAAVHNCATHLIAMLRKVPEEFSEPVEAYIEVLLFNDKDKF